MKILDKIPIRFGDRSYQNKLWLYDLGKDRSVCKIVSTKYDEASRPNPIDKTL